MNYTEYANQLARELLAKPTMDTLISVCDRILKIDGRSTTAEQQRVILRVLSQELGEHVLVSNLFENAEQLTLMGQIERIIAKAHANGR